MSLRDKFLVRISSLLVVVAIWVDVLILVAVVVAIWVAVGVIRVVIWVTSRIGFVVLCEFF